MNEYRWVQRYTTDGEVRYDRSTRNVYRNFQNTPQSSNLNYWSLPTFRSEAPLKAYFDFTYFCNLECRHCITNSSPRYDRQNEMTSDRTKAVISELASIGVLELGIGGGEPLCHSDILSLLSHANKENLNTILTTNGLLVNDSFARRLKETGVTEVRVSFDGCEAVHDNIRGPGVYRKALRGLKTLIDAGVRTVPRLTFCKYDTVGLENLFIDLKSAGATSVKAGVIEPKGRASLDQNQELLVDARDSSITELLLDISKKHGLNIKMPSDIAGCAELSDGGELRFGKIRSCGAGMETAYISPEGDVQPCSGTPEYSFGNLKTNSFMDIWTNEQANAWRTRAINSETWCICVQKLKIIELGVS